MRWRRWSVSATSALAWRRGVKLKAWVRGGSLPHERVVEHRAEEAVCARGRDRVGFEARSAEFAELVGSAEFEVLAEGDLCAHEAAIFVETGAEDGSACVVFTSKPYEKRSGSFFVDIKRLIVEGPRKGEVEVVHSSCNLANGGHLGLDGRLYFCFQGKRIDDEGSDSDDPFFYRYHPSGIYSVDPRNWTDWRAVTPECFSGRHFNSPNDVCVRRTDGSLWFTDPAYAFAQGHAPPPQLGNWLWRLDPATGELAVVADGFAKPNGVCFSPDQRTLYVTDTGSETGAGPADPQLPRSVYAFDVLNDRRLANRRLVYVADRGVPDGIKADALGRLYAGCADGVHVFCPDTGRLLGKIHIIGCDGGAPNLCFGIGPTHQSTLFILAETAVVAVRLRTRGARLGPPKLHDDFIPPPDLRL